MSEWQDMQQKPNTKLRDLLKNRKAKTRKLSELSKTEQNRLAKLNAMLDELRRGENVQNRRLATWLTEEEYEGFESDWESQQQIREELNDKPDELKRYEDKLKKAIFNYSRAEGYSTKGKNSTAKKFYNSSDSLCEDALEILQEIVAADASLHMWFDRGLDFGHGSLVDAQLGNLPRVITSRSFDRQTSDNRLLSKREVKIAAVEWAISALLAVEPVGKKERKEQKNAKLKEFIQSPFLE
ncbi:hypothetical protein N9L23_05925 [Alphaproteobacteria bacterium]|nr:hypothetical protein [Alphaproteobacteria bacterium]